MVSYYGSKSKIVKLYLPPTKDVIIEPFAGTARYSLMYWEKDVRLYDLNPNVIKMWNYLQSASEQDILSLPKLKIGDDLRNFDLSEGERCFLGFCVNEGSANPRNVLTKWAGDSLDFKIKKTIEKLNQIKHWDIKLRSYESIENIDATWFIDPPYFKGGEHYPFSNKNLDFNQLGQWCKERKGEVIVCENDNADWLPFQHLKEHWGGKKKSNEVVFYQGFNCKYQ
jgi:site-specific DNA-adenine methylase